MVEQVLVPDLPVNAIVVMDSLAAHKDAGVRALIEGAGARLVSLPPCSPAFNPVELAPGQGEALATNRATTEPRSPRWRVRAVETGCSASACLHHVESASLLVNL
jgi:hypothetical protein